MSAIPHSHITSISFSSLEKHLQEIMSDQIIILVDENIYKIYKNFIETLSKFENCTVVKACDGEKNKNFEQFIEYSEKVLDIGIHRQTHLLSVGGGATSDFTGFLASTLLRGISWSAVPTTFLSMIDAAIGGKTAINSKAGKNLIGTFHKPENIYICLEFLKSLPDEQMQSGYGELLKYGFLNKEIKEAILDKDDLSKIITLCSKYKEDLTIKDFKELGPRKHLNVGHTVGHALEKFYGIQHGVAVFHGIEIEISMLDKNSKALMLFNKLAKSLDLTLPKNPFRKKDVTEIVNLCFKDKKMASLTELEIIIPENCEHIKSHIFTKEDLNRLLNSYFD
jgi:3-dehydroquinate synthase